MFLVGGIHMKVPMELRKSLYDYLKARETDYVEDLLKSAFPSKDSSKNVSKKKGLK